ncbi:MAG: DUF1638 domain-containing protein [Ilumatobacteraceae bacterium]
MSLADHNRPLIIACGALASELREVLARSGLADVVEVRYLPANLHNRPDGIVPALIAHLDGRGTRPTLVGYADCGTGGALDALLVQYPDVQRLPGAHCYEFFAGSELFAELHDEEPGTFYLTDFLAKHFTALVWDGLGLDRHPQLRDTYFGNYKKLMLLSQSDDPAIVRAAEQAAHQLGLKFEHRHVGRAGLADAIPVSFKRVTISSNSVIGQ